MRNILEKTIPPVVHSVTDACVQPQLPDEEDVELPAPFSKQSNVWNKQSRHTYINSFAADHGYGICKASHSLSKKKEHCASYIRCCREGKHSDTHLSLEFGQLRPKQTKQISCPFAIYIHCYMCLLCDSWTFQVQNGLHNHGPVLAFCYSTNHQLTEAQEKQIQGLSKLSVSAKLIVTKFQEDNPESHLIPKQVHNIYSRHRLRKLTMANPTASIVDKLERYDIPHKIWQSNTGELTQFFITTEEMLDYARRFHCMFLADCTYKTNRWGMPLLQIVGLTCTGGSFIAGACFMVKETTEFYIEALSAFGEFLGKEYSPGIIVTDRELALMQAIKTVFPDCCNILCCWHINKNILAKTNFPKGGAERKKEFQRRGASLVVICPRGS